MNTHHPASWLRESRWGVFCHYLAQHELTPSDWNEQVNGFDVVGFADQIESFQAKYVMFTIGQNSGHFCSPNETYDRIVGVKPSKCSKRDLILDIATELQKREIRLIAYIPSGAPSQDAQAILNLKWKWGFMDSTTEGGRQRTGKRLAEFQGMWEAILREWSRRWGEHVHGWWVDGCYFSDEMYRHADAPNFASFSAAMKAGNPDSIVAFNGGVQTPVISLTQHEDYTAGEVSHALPVLNCYQHPVVDGMVDGAQYHILSYLGDGWGKNTPRLSKDLLKEYTRHIIQQGGAVTWDVPISPAGQIPQDFRESLSFLGKNLR